MVKILEGAFQDQGTDELPTDPDELAREGARRFPGRPLEAEVADYIARHRQKRDERGHAKVVRRGRARARKMTMGSGTVEVRVPRVHDRREAENFTS